CSWNGALAVDQLRHPFSETPRQDGVGLAPVPCSSLSITNFVRGLSVSEVSGRVEIRSGSRSSYRGADSWLSFFAPANRSIASRRASCRLGPCPLAASTTVWPSLL